MVKVIKIAGMDSYIAKFTPEEVAETTTSEEVNADSNNRSVEVVTKTKKSTKK